MTFRTDSKPSLRMAALAQTRLRSCTCSEGPVSAIHVEMYMPQHRSLRAQSHPSRALTHSKATRQKAFGVYIFDCHRLGQADVSGFRLPQPILQFQNNSLGLASRGAFLPQPFARPSAILKTWNRCRAAFLTHVEIGPGGRLDAICEIDADGDVFVRGWVASVPDL
jgi:hypothetical protein